MKMAKRIWSAVLAMVLLLGCAVADETALGNIPARGIIMELTQADIDMGVEVTAYMETSLEDDEIMIPTIVFQYIDPKATEAVYAKLDEMYANADFTEYESTVLEYFDRVHTFARIFLAADEKIETLIRGEMEGVTVLGENDGYTYLLVVYDVTANEQDDAAIVEAARVRCNEMISSIQYQPVVIPEEELAPEPETEVPNAFPVFETVDLGGNTVDNSIFAKADLTVVNLWSTTCYPCISEMPELQAWSEEMPANVQLIGLVLDAPVGNDEYIETAQMICEATGVSYTNLLLCDDMLEFAEGIIFTPTTIFVDRSGAVVGEPITGALVDEYKAFVEEYFNAQ